MSDCSTKFDLKNATGINTSKFAKKVNQASLKSVADKLDTDKLETTPVELSKLSNVVKNDLVKNTVYDELVKKVNAIQTIDTRDLVKKKADNTKIVEIENKIPDNGKYITTQEFDK